MSRVTFEAFHPERVAGAVRQPPLATLVRQAGVRRFRRRVLVSVAVVVLLLAGGLVAWARPDSGMEPLDPPPSGIRDVFFVDPQTIVAVSVTSCDVQFSATPDGGRRWSPFRGLTPDVGPGSSAGPGSSVGPGSYAGPGSSAGPGSYAGPGSDASCRPTGYQVLDGHTFLATVAGQQYLTTDTGQHWRTVTTNPVRVDGFTPGARLLECHGGCAGRTGVQAVDPKTGELQELRATTGIGTLTAVEGTPDGAIWVAGRDLRTGPILAWSIDSGRTWATKALPEKADTDMILVARSAQAAYLLLAIAGQLTVLVTVDAGLTWTSFGHSLDAPPPGQLVGAFSTREGWLVLASAQDVWVSRDSGSSFTRSTPVPDGRPGYTAGLLWVRASDWRFGYVTTDGLTWLRVRLSAG